MISGSLYLKSMISLMELFPLSGRVSDSSTPHAAAARTPFIWIAFSFSDLPTLAMFSSRSSWKKESLLFRRTTTGLSDFYASRVTPSHTLPITFSVVVTTPHSMPSSYASQTRHTPTSSSRPS